MHEDRAYKEFQNVDNVRDLHRLWALLRPGRQTHFVIAAFWDRGLWGGRAQRGPPAVDEMQKSTLKSTHVLQVLV